AVGRHGCVSDRMLTTSNQRRRKRNPVAVASPEERQPSATPSMQVPLVADDRFVLSHCKRKRADRVSWVVHNSHGVDRARAHTLVGHNQTYSAMSRTRGAVNRGGRDYKLQKRA